MRDYFIRRLLLIPPTLIGVTLLVFLVTRFVPGGPLERAIMEAQQAAVGGEMQQRSSQGGGSVLSEDQLNQLRVYYGFDKPWYLSYVQWIGRLVRGDLGESYRYQEPVWQTITERMPISLYFGLITLFITYIVCIPLGIFKAIWHRSVMDSLTSVLIFIGYAVPGYALGALLLLIFAARLEWFPLGGFVSLNFSELSLKEQIADLFAHTFLPLICYLTGSFAVTTMLMKNQLMEQLAADYVRTAIAKGLKFRQAVFRHALRNSLIPVATTFGQNITLLVGGSFLIETVFDIDGFGLLGISAIFDRDYPVVMGIVFFASLLLLVGNILSDILVALIDPRIKFQ